MLASTALMLLGVPVNRVLARIRETREHRYDLFRGFFRGVTDEPGEERDRLQLRLATPTTANRAAELVADLGSGPPHVDAYPGEVTLPITDGAAILPEVVRRLDAAGLALADLALRRPTLDDVFLTLTGQPTPATGSRP